MNVKSVFLTFQGEGPQMGRSAVFVRFAGCNLWSGLERDRGHGAPCSAWCDTDFVGGTEMSVDDIVSECNQLFPWERRMVVLTGGEPALQVDQELLDALLADGWETCMETNGTVALGRLADKIHHLTVSPKRGMACRVRFGECLKVVVGFGGEAWTFEELESLREATGYAQYVLQPQDGPFIRQATDRCVELAGRSRGAWRLGIQAHKHWRVD